MSYQELMRLTMAVKALMKAVERSLMSETYEGIADTMAENYRALHAKIAEHYPDDYYVTTVLALNIPVNADDRQKVSLVQLAATQMYTYLVSLRPPFGGPPFGRHEHDFGRDISDDILDFTKKTLRRALASIDIDFDVDVDEMRGAPPPPPPPPPKKPPVAPDPDDDII